MIAASLIASGAAEGSERTSGANPAEGFVRFQDEEALRNFLSEHPEASRVHPALLWVQGGAGALSPLAAPGFAESVGVESGTFEPNRRYVIPKGELPLAPQSLPSELWGVARIGAEAAWARSKGDPAVTVAVVDTGIDFRHVALADRMRTNDKELAGQQGVDDDGNGYTDDIFGYDFINKRSSPHDDQGHGSHVAGTIAGNAPQDSFFGVAPGVTLIAVKTHDTRGEATEEAVVKGILYAADRGAQVINCSWGGAPEAPAHSQILYDAIKYANDKGAVLVAAAGNDGANNDRGENYPANYALPNVISVAATNRRDRLAYFSNYGATKVHVAAPGDGIYSVRSGRRYTTNSGTSMAAPHVSGAAALIFSALGPTAVTPGQVRDLLVLQARQVDDLSGKVLANGVVALDFLANPTPSH